MTSALKGDMKTSFTTIIICAAASCALLLCASPILTMPRAMVLLSVFVPEANAEDHDDEDDDEGEDDDEDDEGEGEGGDDGGDDDDDRRETDVEDTESMMEIGFDDVDDMDEEFDSQGFIVQTAEILAIDADDTSLELIESLGFAVVRKQSLDALNISIAVIETPPGLSVRDAIARLRQSDPDALYEFNHIYETMRGSDKLNQTLGARKLPATATVTGIGIGLIDTAVDTAHETLRGSRIIHQIFVDADHLPMVHGTSIASLLVGEADDFRGMLPGATLYSAAVFTQSLSGGVKASADSLASALNWLVKQQVAVINMSLAGPSNVLLQVAVRKTLERGHTIVSAVGNDGPAAPPLYPAAYPGVIAITAVDANRYVYRRANRGKHVDFSAIGVNVRAADQRGGYGTFSGTSYAAPVISALLAARLGTPDVTRQQDVFAQLKQQAMDMGTVGRDPVFGYGLLGEAQYVSP